MQQYYTTAAKRYQKRRRWNSTWKKVTMALASVVVFATTYALILPAITLEPVYMCGKEVHLHSETCYQLSESSTASSLICAANTLGIHEHIAECYNENSELKCGIANFVLHTHNSGCLDTNGELVCSLPEMKTHAHDESCWQQPHAHEETCYTQQQGELLCAIPEGSVHAHEDTCYTQQLNQVCTLSEVTAHTHDTGCYSQNKEQICGLNEAEGHTHEAACFDDSGALTCSLSETTGHTHIDECFRVTDTLTCQLVETIGHTHDDICFETETVLICDLDTENAHVHGEDCYAWTSELACELLTAEDNVQPSLTCTEPELVLHEHSAECFDADGNWICGRLQVSEHIHDDRCFVVTVSEASDSESVLICDLEVHEHDESCVAQEETDTPLTGDALVAEGYYCGIAEHSHQDEACYDENGTLMCSMTEHEHIWTCELMPSDPTAVETTEDWEAALPDVQGNIAADLIAVAESQLGYEQSEVNYIIENDEQLFYSRYADWWSYGQEPYGDWNAKFVAFCLDYAGITSVPLEPETATWPTMLEYYEQWQENDGSFSPIPADLVFFDADSDDEADCVGIVTCIDLENSQMTVIHEERGKVRERDYALDDRDILGYARIPGNEPAIVVDIIPENVQQVIDLIEAMPSADDVDALVARYDETESDEDLAAYMAAVEQVNETYRNYAALTEDERALVTNAGKLMELDYVWSQVNLASTQYDASARTDDMTVVSGEDITFKLFDYSLRINKKAANDNWRSNERFFNFRDTERKTGPEGEPWTTSPVGGTSPTTAYVTHNKNAHHDADGFTKAHATVLPTLDTTGNPILDLNHYANGEPNEDTTYTNETKTEAHRRLRYLFTSGDHAVTAYSPKNTILQKEGNHYWYDSRENAVDYDTTKNLFRVRNYVERNEITAKIEAMGHCTNGYDFLPFTYTGGTVVGTKKDSTTNRSAKYHVAYNATDGYNVNYWFGMTMEFSFYQSKGGKLDGQNMIFNFSGDDDVWVFIDDVLVLDLGGTHGTATGSINFATGEVKQYLSWKDGTESDTATSFPTTIRKRFDAAGKTPNGGWNSKGKTFADYTTHTLKFFYLERGAGVANCNIDFLLPTLPKKSLTVSKNLTTEGSGDITDFLTDTLSYKFRVVKADENGKATDELFIKAGMTYTIKEGTTKIGTGTVDANGYFTLKHGQSAQFTNMLGKGDGATTYIVQELVPSDLKGQYGEIEYVASGTTGTIKTEAGKTQNFATYSTGVLSAGVAQTVTYYNKVDTAKLSQLQLTKRHAPGADFTEGEIFKIQVKLGGELLPKGTEYKIGNTVHTVATAGIVELQKDQTATIQGILSGTTYEITEVGAGTDGFNASYSGTVTDSGGNETDLSLTGGSVSGEFPLSSTVHITVTNADYDFAGEIPIYKQALDNSDTVTFHFLVEQIEVLEDKTWQTVKPVPGTSITVSDDTKHAGTVTLGYKTGDGGDYFYLIREQAGEAPFLYDDTFYIAKVQVSDTSTSIQKIWKNGTEEVTEILFVNRKPTSVKVTKEVVGVTDYTGAFDFSATVTLDGEPFTLAQSADYTVSGNTATFTLCDGQEIVLTGIPYHAVVTVTETPRDGFIAKYQVEGEQLIAGDSAVIEIVDSPQTVHFKNHVCYELPETGGLGTASWYYAGGGTLLTASTLWRKKQRYRGRRLSGD